MSDGGSNTTVDAIMARCIEFVRSNEGKLEEMHRREDRTYHVQLQRSRLEEVWGLTWAAKLFSAKRRVLEAIVPGTPAGRWNDAVRAALESGSGTQPQFEVGDELIAVNGKSSWEEMAQIRHLLHASLTMLRSDKRESAKGSAAEQAPPSGVEPSKEIVQPPLFAAGGYSAACGDGWCGHVSGEWLHNEAEKAYFHLPSGKLFIQSADGSDGFTCVMTQGAKAAAAATGKKEPDTAMPAMETLRLQGKIRWFNARKGFGCVVPVAQGATAASQDIFLHHSQILEELSPDGDLIPVPVLPGTPVTYVLGKKDDDGRFCAKEVSLETDLASLLKVVSATGKAALATSPAKVQVKAADGRHLNACFASFASERRSVGGAEYVALRLARDLESCFTGREAGGEKGAKAALLAAAKQTQQGFLEYAHRLSTNSASLWLSADVAACSALVYGPDSDGHAKLCITVVGNSGAVVLSRTGAIKAAFGAAARTLQKADEAEVEGEDGSLGPSKKRKVKADGAEVLKAADASLKGPEFTFPIFAPRAGPATGFGAQAWQKIGGSSAGLQLDVQCHTLDWEDDAVVVLGSGTLWQSLPEPNHIAHLALGAWDAGSDASSKLLHAARSSKRWGEDCATVVLRLPWSTGLEVPEYVDFWKSTLTTKMSGDVDALKDDDIFAPPAAGPATTTIAVDDMFAV